MNIDLIITVYQIAISATILFILRRSYINKDYLAVFGCLVLFIAIMIGVVRFFL